MEKNQKDMKIRVGFGFDVHQLVAGRELWLGGVRLEHEKGLVNCLKLYIKYPL